VACLQPPAFTAIGRTSRPTARPGSAAGAMPRSSSAGRGNAPEPWPPRRRAVGRDHCRQISYKALLPNDLNAVCYLRTVRPVRNEAQPPSTKPRAPRSLPDAEAGFSKGRVRRSVRRGAISSPSAIHGCIRHGRRAFPISGPDWARAAGCSAAPRSRRERHEHRRQHHVGPAAGSGAWTDQESGALSTHGVGRDGRTLKPPMANAYMWGLKRPSG